MKNIALIALLLLTACDGYRRPTLDTGNVERMSSDTLCYRYAYGKRSEAMKSEMEARNLDCNEILESQPAVGESRW